jgi:hypothetical protein
MKRVKPGLKGNGLDLIGRLTTPGCPLGFQILPGNPSWLQLIDLISAGFFVFMVYFGFSCPAV